MARLLIQALVGVHTAHMRICMKPEIGILSRVFRIGRFQLLGDGFACVLRCLTRVDVRKHQAGGGLLGTDDTKLAISDSPTDETALLHALGWP